MRNTQTNRSLAIQRLILGYVMANPRAEDSLEGIVEWWLLEQRIKVATEEVRQAIESLVANAFLIEREITDSQLLYHVNPDKLEEVRAVLSGPSDEMDRENDL